MADRPKFQRRNRREGGTATRADGPSRPASPGDTPPAAASERAVLRRGAAKPIPPLEQAEPVRPKAAQPRTPEAPVAAQPVRTAPQPQAPRQAAPQAAAPRQTQTQAVSGPAHSAQPRTKAAPQAVETVPPQRPTAQARPQPASRPAEAASQPQSAAAPPRTATRQAAPEPRPAPAPVQDFQDYAPQGRDEPDRRPAPAQRPAPAAETAPEDTGQRPGKGPRVVSGWSLLRPFSPDPEHLAAHRLITASRDDPTHSAFDVLRTRLLRALSENGWRRVAITSPNKGCGKTFTAANLAISLARQRNCRTVLLDLDLRRPSLHEVLGIANPGAIGDMLTGVAAPQDHLLRLGANSFDAGPLLAFGCNAQPETNAAEILNHQQTARSLDQIEALLDPDVMLFDLPPALVSDDVIALQPMFDGVIIVVGGGITKPADIKEVERRLGGRSALLGMVLNQAEAVDPNTYGYY